MNMNSYILAVDGGTQSTKLALFDLSGHEICAETVQLAPIEFFDDGRAEHPEDDLWTTLKEACRGLFGKFSGKKQEIIGVGLGSVRCCRALLKEDGSLASPVQSWMDLRLSRPYEHEDDEVCYVTTATGYLTFRLTGDPKDTRSNYVGPWPIDPEKLEWYGPGEQFESFSTPREMLFELADPSSVLGAVTAQAAKETGIPEGIPVVSTANDKAVEGLGAGLADDGTVLVSLGTYITSMMAGTAYNADTVHYWSNPGAVRGEFLYESSGIRRGMATVTWIRDLLGSDILNAAAALGVSPETYLNRAGADVPVGCDGLYTVLNWLARPTHLHERGMMIGFNSTHKGPHIFRSILEGIALTMKNHVQAMCDERGIKLTGLIVSGGGSKGDLFMQIFADVFNLPARRNLITDSASLGAAICTALALGVYSGPQEAIEHMVRMRDVFKPIAKHARLYEKINREVYQNITSVTEELLKRSHSIFNSRG